MAKRPVGIIGAGPAGLAMAAGLKARGIDFEILDAGRGVGGIWDIDREMTPMYESAHFISSKTRSAFLLRKDMSGPVRRAQKVHWCFWPHQQPRELS